MKKYRASKTNKTIQIVECDRESATSVWVDGIRSLKTTCVCNYCDTFGEAKNFLLQGINEDIRKANAKLNLAEKQLLSVTMWNEGENKYYA